MDNTLPTRKTKEKVGIVVPPELQAQVKAYSEATYYTISDLYEMGVREWLANHPLPDDGVGE